MYNLDHALQEMAVVSKLPTHNLLDDHVDATTLERSSFPH